MLACLPLRSHYHMARLKWQPPKWSRSHDQTEVVATTMKSITRPDWIWSGSQRNEVDHTTRLNIYIYIYEVLQSWSCDQTELICVLPTTDNIEHCGEEKNYIIFRLTIVVPYDSAVQLAHYVHVPRLFNAVVGASKHIADCHSRLYRVVAPSLWGEVFLANILSWLD